MDGGYAPGVRGSGSGAAKEPRGLPVRSRWVPVAFLLPAVVVLAGYVAYPVVYSVVRSLYDRSGVRFVGLANYAEVFSDRRTRTALKNNMIWVVVAPTLVT